MYLEPLWNQCTFFYIFESSLISFEYVLLTIKIYINITIHAINLEVIFLFHFIDK